MKPRGTSSVGVEKLVKTRGFTTAVDRNTAFCTGRGNIRLYRTPDKLHLELNTRSSAIAEGQRDASCQLKSCQLPRNSAETTYTTSPEQIDGMKLEI